MAKYALTESVTGTMVLRNLDADAVIGAELHIDPADGPLLASMLDDQWPPCRLCDDRERCEACGQCPSCDCLCGDDHAPAVTR
jgi:hypothetical protein